MERYLNPTNDAAFKKVFATEENKPLLRSLLNGLLRLEGDRQIAELQVFSRQIPPLLPGVQNILFDVQCKDGAGNQYIVKIQNRVVPEYFFKHDLFYSSPAYVSQLSTGQPCLHFSPVILLSICNQDMFPEPDAISYHQILNVDNGKQHLKDIGCVFVELQKFKETENELTTLTDQWLFFLKMAHSQKEVPIAMRESEVKRAFDVLEQFNWSQMEYDLYIRVRLATESELGALEEAKEKGFQEGFRQGLQEVRRATAANMLKQGIPMATIQQATGLSEEEIRG